MSSDSSVMFSYRSPMYSQISLSGHS